jgi:hypothetical protein
MAVVEVAQVTESLRGLGITVVVEEYDVDEDAPVVSWADDLPGFLDAAGELGVTEAYVGTLRIDEDLLESFEDVGDEEGGEQLEPLRQILDEARTMLGQEAGTQAIFLIDGIMHEFYTLTPEARDLFERIEQFVDGLDEHEHGEHCDHDH